MTEEIKNSIFEKFKKVAEGMMDTLKESKFIEEGVLTPEEFVLAGDLLVFKCPTWSWEKAADPSRRVEYLPEDKQFLITRKVPCKQRFHEAGAKSGSMVEDDEWLAVEAADADADQDAQEIPDFDNEKPVTEADLGGDDDSIPDMDEFDEENNLVEEDAATAKGNEILKTRTYDISITYDKYFQTPKVWLFGYSESQRPLKPEEIFMDISSDHAKKTVTVDTHPGLGIPFVYVHPCKHAHVMKKFIERMLDSGKVPRPDQYLLLFLKFLGAVIPTISYDNTFEVGL